MAQVPAGQMNVGPPRFHPWMMAPGSIANYCQMAVWSQAVARGCATVHKLVAAFVDAAHPPSGDERADGNKVWNTTVAHLPPSMPPHVL